MNKKNILVIILLLGAVVYGFLVGHFRIFPFQQIRSLEKLLHHQAGNFEPDKQVQEPQDIEIVESFLKRLILKKIPVPGFSGFGGGLSHAGEWLFLITNKGSVRTYNLEDYGVPDFNIPDVPMNLGGLIRSGYTNNDNFNMLWFRVNGLYSEKDSSGNFTLFASHNAFDTERDCITHNISRIKLTAVSEGLSSPENWDTIFTAEPCIDPEPAYILASRPYPGHISGGALTSYSDDLLLATVGDYNRHGIDGTEKFAMATGNPYGKHILLNKETGEWTVYAIGNRNPSGIYIDKSGIIWSVENGPEAGDELNIISRESNYGWPDVSYGHWYDPEFNLPGNATYGTHEDYIKPAFSWIPSIAPSSIIKIEGSKFEHWNGDLIIGTMKDRSLHRLRLDQNNRVIYDEPINIGHRIRDMIVLQDDKIALTTDDGFLIFIEDGGPAFRDQAEQVEQAISELNLYDRFLPDVDSTGQELAVKNSKTIYEQHCSACHNLNAASGIGPHLNNLLNRTVGSADDFNYSVTLRQDNRKWTPELLESFLRNPENEFSGNRMQNIELSEEETGLIIEYLLENSTVSKVNNP